MGLRQARLRNEYAAWYPSIAVNIWIRASTVARAVARQLLEERQGEPWDLGPRWAVGQRILDDRHFVFRGGPERAPMTLDVIPPPPLALPGTPDRRHPCP